jgi:hypothetical protein
MRGPCDHGNLKAHLWPLAGWDGESPGEGSSRTSGIDPLRSFGHTTFPRLNRCNQKARACGRSSW